MKFSFCHVQSVFSFVEVEGMLCFAECEYPLERVTSWLSSALTEICLINGFPTVTVKVKIRKTVKD